MKKLQSKRNILFGISFCIILAITAMAFQDSTIINNRHKQSLQDTIPQIHNNDIDIELNLTDLDKTIKQSLEMAEKSMKEIDWNKISKQVEQSIKQIDITKLQMEINNSMKAIDLKKSLRQAQIEINRSMKEIDMSKMKLEIEKELKNVRKNINSEEMKKSMEEIKKINFDELKKEMENLKKEMELNKDHFKLEMDKAKLEMLKAKTELGEIKEMTNEMEKDGLINKKESNTIEFKNKELFINGKKQSQQITEKYLKYFKGDNFKFKFSGGN
jgi:hypothetical protein